MSTTKRALSVPRSVRRQIRALQQRVSWLEKALRPRRRRKPGASSDDLRAYSERGMAEWTARSAAIREYLKQDQLARYQQNPELLRIAEQNERRFNEFLKDRGMKPSPSDLPEIRRQLAKLGLEKGSDPDDTRR